MKCRNSRTACWEAQRKTDEHTGMQAGNQKKTHATVTSGGSALQRYQDTIVGHRSLAKLLYYELCMWLGALPGAVGLLARKVLWPRLFAECGRGTVFGAHVFLRHPSRIKLGSAVVISDGCILDGRNPDTESAIVIGDDTILSNNVLISCKNGCIKIGHRVGVGAQTIIQSVNGSKVSLGDDVMVGPACYVAGGGNYNMDRLDVPMAKQGLRDEKGVTLSDDVWLGAGVCVLSGGDMATGCVAAAGAVVLKPMPERSICGGVPAKVIRTRGGQ